MPFSFIIIIIIVITIIIIIISSSSKYDSKAWFSYILRIPDLERAINSNWFSLTIGDSYAWNRFCCITHIVCLRSFFFHTEIILENGNLQTNAGDSNTIWCILLL